ncbi:MAG: hypothetical protein H6732_09460 [Alphaproteobacteria bacterium]|nr:hypothetical protein [Alphaproteobacteria bacterium]
MRLLPLLLLAACSGVCLSEGRAPDVCLYGVYAEECQANDAKSFQGADWAWYPICPTAYRHVCDDAQTWVKQAEDCYR